MLYVFARRKWAACSLLLGEISKLFFKYSVLITCFVMPLNIDNQQRLFLEIQMAYEIDRLPEPTAAQVRALWMFGSYLCRKFKSRDAARDAAAWIRRSVDATYTRYRQGLHDTPQHDLEWVPTTGPRGPYEVSNMFHASTSEADSRSLFNLFRGAVIHYVIENEVVIDEDMLPFWKALEPDLGEYLDTEELTKKYGVQQGYFFDREYVEGAFKARAIITQIRPEQLVERYLIALSGIRLIYRISTPRSSEEMIEFEQCKINVSLMRIRPSSFLDYADKLSPRFTYDFNAEGSGKHQKAVGYTFPMDDKINLLGKTTSANDSSVISFTWPEPDGWAQHESDPLPRVNGLAYSTNSSRNRIAFYFIGDFLPDSRNIDPKAFDKAVNELKHVIGQYKAGEELKQHINEVVQKAQDAMKCDESSVFDNYTPPTKEELHELFKRSRRDVVFRAN